MRNKRIKNCRIEKLNQTTKGFSLIELMTGLVILATLSLVSIPTYKRFIKRPYHAWLKTEMGKQTRYLELIRSVDGGYHQYLYAMGYKIRGKLLGNVGFKTGPNEKPCCNLYPDPTNSTTTSSDLSEYNYITLPKAMVKWDGSTTTKGGLFTNAQSICAHSQGCVLTTLVDIKNFTHHGLTNNTNGCNYKTYANNYLGAWCDCESYSLMGVSHYGRSGAVKADILKGDAIFILNQAGLFCEADRNKKDGTLKPDLHF